MNVYYSSEEAQGKIGKSVVTTGSFDGVHIGHKMIINRLKVLASEIGGESTLVTFYPHPRKVLYPEQKDLKLINSQDEKIELLSKTGLDNLVVIPFSKEFAKTSSHDFITHILVNQLDAKRIIVGQNHHFGHNRSGDFSYLHELSNELGFQVEDIPLKDIENETVSSTKIRKALKEGNIMRANAYLDHQYIISAKLTPSNTMELKAEVWKSIIEEEEKLIPPPGIYATNLLLNGSFFKTMTVIQADCEDNFCINNIVMFSEKLNTEHPKGTLYFYKKICGNEDFTNGIPDRFLIKESMEEVEELIY